LSLPLSVPRGEEAGTSLRPTVRLLVAGSTEAA
jgi:hypothetical protein